MIAAFIQARMGSQRCKKKMVRDFAGTNLISLALEKFSKPTDMFKLYFAAYEPELLEIGNRFNCSIIKRNKESAEGESIEIVMNYLSQIKEENVMFINACHPFLTLQTMEEAVSYFESNNLVSMTAVTKSHTWYYHLDGRPINFLDPTNLNTKTSEPVFKIAHAFHVFNKERFLKEHYFWTHKEKDPFLFEISEKEAIDIDTELDFARAESFYIRENDRCTDYLNEKLSQIKLLIFDVDGVLTDAGMYYSQNGDELKKFNTRDGMGIKMLREAGIKSVIITGEDTLIVRNRADKLKIEDVFLGVNDKLLPLNTILNKYSLDPKDVAYIGDDINDISILKMVGLPIAVSDAVSSVKNCAHYITKASGGCGAVREVCDLILNNKHKFINNY